MTSPSPALINDPMNLELLKLAARTIKWGRSPVLRPAIERYCEGEGLEVGAGKTPLGDPSRTTFLDRQVDDKDATENADIIADATAIPRPDESFDYVIASHVLEHMPNTIAALKEWLRVLKPGGTLFIVLPHAEKTIDQHRQVTTLDHLIADYEAGIDSSDRTHFDEIKEGWSKLPPWEDEFRAEWGAEPWDWDFRIEHGVIHYHVWTQNEILELFYHLGLQILYVNDEVPDRPDSFMVVARKPPAGPLLRRSQPRTAGSR